MSMTWEVSDDTKWVEKAMDEYHNHLQPEKITQRNWKFSDVMPKLQSQFLMRAAELKKAYTVKHYTEMALEAKGGR
jgi:hypothetical protein